ncbi:hypothetical protein SNOUR_36755 [Streptomyces noursei ATCC 11455]|nr:hypothetical protein SNOUR_36755 [Streptomyces noursei ATCC 11455]
MLLAAQSVYETGAPLRRPMRKGAVMAKPVRAALGGVWIKCSFCQGDLFRDREVKLNSSGMEFMNLSWANESATGLICWNCGYVQLFVNRDLELYKQKKGQG